MVKVSKMHFRGCKCSYGEASLLQMNNLDEHLEVNVGSVRIELSSTIFCGHKV